MANKNILYGGIGIAAAFVLYEVLKPSTPTTIIPPGGSLGNFTNLTGTSAIVTASGQVLSALGNVIGTITTATNSSGQSSPYFTPNVTYGANTNDNANLTWDPTQGTYQYSPLLNSNVSTDTGAGVDTTGTDSSNMGGMKIGCECVSNQLGVYGRRKEKFISGF